ncbi:MAG: DUF262 domain-containing protein [Labilithrix sp.]
MEIKPSDVTVKKLLEGNFYRIPRFQRPYSWDRENVEDFWNDAIVADDADYFIGSFVVYRNADPYGPLFVVDGQQRLTTITILLASVRDAMESEGHKALAKGVHQLIERQDLNSDQQFVLQTETSYPYLQEHIQKHGHAELEADLGEEEVALKEAYEYLSDQVTRTLRAVDANPSVTAKKKVDQKRQELIRIRDRVMRLQLIVIELTKEDEAYLIFETLNTRGKDLTVSDLVKNHLARNMKPKNKNVDVLGDRWASLLETLEGSKADLDVNRFLHHSWLSRRPYTGEKQLFAAIKKAVTKSEAPEFLKELLADAKAYRTAFEADYHEWTKQESDIAEALRALQVFRVLQPAPMLLAIVRAYQAKSLTIKQTATVLQQLESFHLQFTAITAQRTGGGTAKMYALSGRSLWEATDKNKAGRVLRDFTNKLRERVPSEDEFVAGFAQLKFSDENTKQKALVRYVLQRIDAHLRKGAPPDYDKFTIEHVAPQKPATGKPAVRMADIGNLILVPQKLNERLRNETFVKKKQLMTTDLVPMDDVLKKASSWGDEEIAARSKAMATLACQKIFAI